MSALSPKRTKERHRKINPLGAKHSKGTIAGKMIYGREPQAPPMNPVMDPGMVSGAPAQMPNDPMIVNDPGMVQGAPAQMPNQPVIGQPIDPGLRPPRRYPKFMR